jgi:hypothetical protein
LAHPDNSGYSGGRDLDYCDSISLGKKVSKTSISVNKNLGMVACACHPSYVGSINRRVVVQASPGKKGDPISEITRGKKKGGSGDVA